MAGHILVTSIELGALVREEPGPDGAHHYKIPCRHAKWQISRKLKHTFTPWPPPKHNSATRIQAGNAAANIDPKHRNLHGLLLQLSDRRVYSSAKGAGHSIKHDRGLGRCRMRYLVREAQ